MAGHSTILAWEIPWTDKPGRLQSMGSQRSRTQLSTHTAACLYQRKINKANVEQYQQLETPL